MAEVIKPSNGLVIHYNYLWAREFDRREESGRKDVRRASRSSLPNPGREHSLLSFPLPPNHRRQVGRRWKFLKLKPGVSA
jgi:hypothetical protein